MLNKESPQQRRQPHPISCPPRSGLSAVSMAPNNNGLGAMHILTRHRRSLFSRALSGSVLMVMALLGLVMLSTLSLSVVPATAQSTSLPTNVSACSKSCIKKSADTAGCPLATGQTYPDSTCACEVPDFDQTLFDCLGTNDCVDGDTIALYQFVRFHGMVSKRHVRRSDMVFVAQDLCGSGPLTPTDFTETFTPTLTPSMETTTSSKSASKTTSASASGSSKSGTTSTTK